MSLRAKRLAIGVPAHTLLLSVIYGLAALSAAAESSAAGLFGMLFFIYIFTLRRNPLGRKLAERWLKEVECPSCGELLQLEDNWGCPHCTYVSWQPRHAMSPCQNLECQKSVAFIHCWNCDQSLQI